MNTTYPKIAEFLFNVQTKSISNPFKLNFAVTYKCNFKCITCKIWEVYKKSPELKKNELKLGEIEKIFENSGFLRWISFTGGEPFLRCDLDKIVKTAYENCKHLFMVNIPSNGFYTRKIIQTTKRVLDKTSIPIFLIAINCDGGKEIHDLIKNKKNSWKKSIRTFRSLVRIQKSHSNLQVILEYTLSKINEKYFPEDIQKLNKLGVDVSRVHLNIFHTSNHFYHNSSTDLFVSPSITERINLLRRIRRGTDPLTIFSNVYDKILERNLANRNYPFKHCFGGRGSVFLDPYGNLYPCIIFNRRIGSIRNSDYNLIKILKSKRAMMIKKLIQYNKCQGCFTPCEIYQNMISNPFDVVKNIFM